MIGSAVLLVLGISLGAWANDAAEVPCECPKLACDSCSFEQGITFFSDKCGPNNSKVKSCARPTCIPIDKATKDCPTPPAANSGPRAPIVVKAVEAINPTTLDDPRGAPIGKIKPVQNQVTLVIQDGRRVVVKESADIRETDTIETDATGGAVVEFEGGNKLHVHPATVVQVKEFQQPRVAQSRKQLLQLVKGKIRNQVEQKYNDKTSYYRVVTKGAVAGVRGTVFVMSADEVQGGAGAVETRVETIGGMVALAGPDGRDLRSIGRGEGATAVEGKISDIYVIPPARLRELERDSRVDVATARARHRLNEVRKDIEICSSPKGFFNQCMWRCQNNPAGEQAGCRTSQAGVACLRSRCNGNGKWSDETKLPANLGASACPATGFLVKDCDY